MVPFTFLFTLIWWISVQCDVVYGNCTGGVSSQTINNGDTGLTELILPRVRRSVKCMWEVKSLTNGLRLDLTTFTLPESDLCREGSLQITVGDYGQYDSVTLDKWCGQFYPRSLQLSGHVTITLRLEPTESRAGFKMKFTSILPSEFCATHPVNLSGSGLIYSPGHGGHWSVVPSLSCDWRIQADTGHVVQVEIMHVDFSEWACLRQQAKLVAFDGILLNKIASWCKTNEMDVVKSTRSSLHLTYVNKVPHRGSGFVLKYYQVPDYESKCASFVRDVQAYRTPTFISIFQAPSEGSKHCRWSITTENSNEIVVMETEYYDLGSIGCSYVELNYYDSSGPARNNLQRQTCSGIQHSSHNVIHSSGRHAYLELVYNAISPSVAPVRALIKVYSIPRVPCWKKHRIYMADFTTSRLWVPLTSNNSHSACDTTVMASDGDSCVKVQISARKPRDLSLYDYFDIYDGVNASANRYTPLCSAKGKHYTYSTGSSLFLKQRLSPLGYNTTNLTTDGFWLDFSSDTDCEIGDYEVLKTEQTDAKSYQVPPQLFSHNTSQLCQYVIVTSIRSVIQLYLTNHPRSVQSKSNCTDHQVIISDDKERDQEIGWWCSGRGYDYVSKGYKVYIQYMRKPSSAETAAPSIVYRSRLRELCQRFLSAPENSGLTLTSPYFPVFYPNQADCSWTISASRRNYRVEVSLIEVDMGPGLNCSEDYVLFNEDAHQERFCKPEEVRRRPIRSLGQVMKAHFHSDKRITAKGFKATYKSIKSYQCNETLLAETITGKQQYISSPFFPNLYHDNMACFYLIQTIENRVIQTQMALSDLGQSQGSCGGDRLTFYDGRDESAPVIGRVCSRELSQHRSSGRYLYLVFKSDGDGVTYRGFQLQYYSVFKYEGCEGDSIGRVYGNTTKDGYLVSPFYPGGFPVGTACHWRVYVGTGYQVQVTAETSNILGSCIKFQVKFYDGAHSSSHSLGVWCGGAGQVFVSTSNVMTIEFHSNIQTMSGFRLSYKATGAGPSRSRTALIVGIIVGSVVFVTLIFTIVICCCCCCTKGKKKKKGVDTEDDSPEKRKAAVPLIKKRESLDETRRQRCLVPSAPPMEETGADNSGFVFDDLQTADIQNGFRSQSLYPVLTNLSPESAHPRPMRGQIDDEDQRRNQLIPERREERQQVRELNSQPGTNLRQYQQRLGKDFDPSDRYELRDRNDISKHYQNQRKSNDDNRTKLYNHTDGKQSENEVTVTPESTTSCDKGNTNKEKKKNRNNVKSKQKRKSPKVELQKKVSIECDDIDVDEHTPPCFSPDGRQRQYQDEHEFYPEPLRSDHFDEVPFSMSPYTKNENYSYDPSYRQTNMHPLYNTTPPMWSPEQYIPYQPDASWNGLVNHHQVQAEVHSPPVFNNCNQYGCPSRHDPSFLYQIHPNMSAHLSHLPRPGCTCPECLMSAQTRCMEQQQIWSTSSPHHIPQHQIAMLQGPSHNGFPAWHYTTLPSRTTHVPMLIPIHEPVVACTRSTRHDDVTEQKRVTTEMKHEELEPGTSTWVVPPAVAGKRVSDVNESNEKSPPDPSHLSSLLLPTHWIRQDNTPQDSDIPVRDQPDEDRFDELYFSQNPNIPNSDSDEHVTSTEDLKQIMVGRSGNVQQEFSPHESNNIKTSSLFTAPGVHSLDESYDQYQASTPDTSSHPYWDQEQDSRCLPHFDQGRCRDKNSITDSRSLSLQEQEQDNDVEPVTDSRSLRLQEQEHDNDVEPVTDSRSLSLQEQEQDNDVEPVTDSRSLCLQEQEQDNDVEPGTDSRSLCLQEQEQDNDVEPGTDSRSLCLQEQELDNDVEPVTDSRSLSLQEQEQDNDVEPGTDSRNLVCSSSQEQERDREDHSIPARQQKNLNVLLQQGFTAEDVEGMDETTV